MRYLPFFTLLNNFMTRSECTFPHMSHLVYMYMGPLGILTLYPSII